MTYEDMRLWAKGYDLLSNRIKVINQVTGAESCKLAYRKGRYVCKWCGSDYATWRVWDLDGLQSAFARVDALSDALWLANRSDVLRIVTNN